ncbi:HD-GYP domain-containing protein [Clostridium frigoris]|uniref:HD-GYP domain-containing protein n=1 Tax=Clostridium frigoris TaxID=205327 RepID=A0ABS6BYR2_9CLOT|nr:HD-GYP domain-containing protein [Clostridium frigoris]MBU3161747.1 HD-GYP domain-containing protein [Clostridium frigoris]
MSNKFFKICGIFIISVNIIIFLVLSYYLLYIWKINMLLPSLVQIFFILNIFFSIIVYSKMNKAYHTIETTLENAYLSGFEAMAALVDAKDFYTGEHSKNVSKYVSMICNNLNCGKNKKDIKNKVRIAATFHDLGKIGVPDIILKNPGKLSDSEYAIMKSHPVIGANVIAKIDGFTEISTIIRHHHERWDGNGYPDGLKGNEIPFGSQIISIADTFDAITSDRVYRKGLNKTIALKILIEEKGKQFNPELVDIFIKSINITKD